MAPVEGGPLLLRRLLLALVTALIVARPLVLGEDAGLSISLADPWGMVLTLLWLLAAVGWAAWRYWLRSSPYQPAVALSGTDPLAGAASWYGGMVQTALLATVALVFVSAEVAARYKFPARLIAWEWFGLFVSFFVVRQLAITSDEQHGLFAVVLAGVVALSGQGIYQQFVELSSNRRLAEDPEAFRKAWAEENPAEDANEGMLEQLRLRALESNIYGPYAHPNSFASYLVLGLPGLIGSIILCHRSQTTKWQTVLTAVCAVVGLSALWLTHSRGAILALAAAGVGLAAFVFRRQLHAYALTALVGLLLLLALAYGVGRSGLLTTGMGKSGNTIAQRLEYWRTTWQMIRERPWLGVGPGNFSENYTRWMPDNAEEKIKDPHNFVLEIWATCGVFALLALLTTLTTFCVRIVQGDRTSTQQKEGTETPLLSLRIGEPPLRWEFFLGGMFGLLLGFVLRVNTATPNSILAETYSAALRAVIWFAAFGLFERVAWPDRARALVLTTGIVALLLNLCVSGGIGFPSVAGMMWIGIALALNAAALRPVPWLSQAGAARILPLPIFLGLFLGYGVYILYPILASDDLVREALQAVAFFRAERAKPPNEQAAGVRNNPIAYIQKGVIERLEEAARLTPDDARIYVQLAWWTNVVWDLKRGRTHISDLPIAERAIRNGMRAVELDPQGAAGYLVQYRMRLAYAELNEEKAKAAEKAHGENVFIREREETARRQYELAAQTLEEYLPNDPHDAELHYGLARAWFKADDKEKGRLHAEEALRLDDLVHIPARKLTDRQCEQLRAWIEKPLAR